MIIGAHSIIYSTSPAADRAFLRDALRLPNVDVGDGWLFIAEMKKHNVACGPAQDRGWGVLTQLTLPGGGKLTVYQPRHARPKALGEGASARKPVRQTRRAAAKNVRRKAPKKKARKR